MKKQSEARRLRRKSGAINKTEFLHIEKRNAYICQKCRHLTLTVHIDEGMTPAFIACEKPLCDGMAVSFFYRIPPPLQFTGPQGSLAPSKEWYRPSKIEMNMLAPRSREHIENGGLLLRDRTQAEALKIKTNIIAPPEKK